MGEALRAALASEALTTSQVAECRGCLGPRVNAQADGQWRARRLHVERPADMLARGGLCGPCAAWYAGLATSPPRFCDSCQKTKPAAAFTRGLEALCLDDVAEIRQRAANTCNDCGRRQELAHKARP